MGYAIEVSQMSKSYSNVIAVDHIDLRVEEGEFFAFLGPNGAENHLRLK